MEQNNVFYNIHIAFPKQGSQNEGFVRSQKNVFVKRLGSGKEKLSLSRNVLSHFCAIHLLECLNFKRRIKSHLPSVGIFRSSPYSPR